MSPFDAIRALRAELLVAIEDRLARVGWFAKVATTSATGERDTVEGQVAKSGEQPTGVTGRRVEPFGFRSVPPVGIMAAVVRLMARATSGVQVGVSASNPYGPSDLEDGEVAIYCKAIGALWKFDKNGKVSVSSSTGQPIQLQAGAGANVTIDAGAGGRVVLMGGVLNVARAGADTAGPYAISGGNPFVSA